MDSLSIEIQTANDSGSQTNLIANPGNKISTVKLNNDNFLMWKIQIELALEGHSLGHFIAKYCDPPFERIPVSESSTITKSNPEFLKWKKHDSLISS